MANWPAIFAGFTAKGIPEADIRPRENVFTYRAWRALGRQVRRGEHGVKTTTFVTSKGLLIAVKNEHKAKQKSHLRRIANGLSVEAPGIEPATPTPQSESATQVTECLSLPLAHSLARETQIDPDLARLIDAWPSLPATVKRMILAALQTSQPGE